MTRAAWSKSFNLPDARQYQYLIASAAVFCWDIVNAGLGKREIFLLFATYDTILLFILLVKCIFFTEEIREKNTIACICAILIS